MSSLQLRRMQEMLAKMQADMGKQGPPAVPSTQPSSVKSPTKPLSNGRMNGQTPPPAPTSQPPLTPKANGV
jgi:hypothetical protein